MKAYSQRLSGMNNSIFDPSRQSAEDFLGLTPAERESLHEEGYRIEGLKVVRFLDDLDTSPWFYRAHELLGYVFAVCDGGRPAEPNKVLTTARKTFGVCDVLW